MIRGMKQAGGEQVACVAHEVRRGQQRARLAGGRRSWAADGSIAVSLACCCRILLSQRLGSPAPRHKQDRSLSGADMPGLELRDIVSLHVA